jgi:hypothetical protein
VSLAQTRKRLYLLACIEAGRCARYGDGCDYVDVGHKVTQAVAKMQRHGWVELEDGPGWKRPWRLTELGAAVLAERKKRDERGGT